MRKILTCCIFSFFFILLSYNIFSQCVIKGMISDENSKMPIAFAYIYVNGKIIATSDQYGKYKIETKENDFKIGFQFPTYKSVEREIKLRPNQKELILNISLNVDATVLNEVSVESSLYTTNVQKSTISIAVISPKNFENKNATSLDKALDGAGGLVIADNEPQMRGGSGFSSGMGSRVMILLDEIPLLRGDAGRPAWNFIPMEDVEQIEVIKGSASVIYGSSAISGAINVRSAYPRTQPKTYISTYFGMYDTPKTKYRISWLKNNPIFYGLNFLHSRQIKKNFDLVIGGEYYNNDGYIGGPEKIQTSRDRISDTTHGKFEQRVRFNFGTRYRFQKTKGLSVGLNGNFMYSRNNQSYFWYDSDTNMYRAYPGSLTEFQDFMFYLDPYIRYISANGMSHSINNRITYSDNKASNNQSCMSVMVYNEYQYSQTYRKLRNLKLTAGIMNLYTYAFGQVFNGDHNSSDPSATEADNMAIYAQLEKKFFKRQNLILQGGARWEFYKIGNKSENKPIFRVGANYEIPKIRTTIRASWGQGYRYPSIGEKFIATSVGQYGFYPNPDLVSETSWNAEIGIVQPMKLAEFKALFDIAYFYQDYKNFIEFAMGPWNKDPDVFIANRMGFKYLNTGPARIQGIDCSFMGTGEIGRNTELTIQLCYTYSKPQAKEPDLIYGSEGSRTYSYISTSSDTTDYVLKYRIQHLAKFDLDFTFWKTLGIGFSGTYYSQMKNVDKFFYSFDKDNPTLSDFERMVLSEQGDLPFSGIYSYMQSHQNGNVVFDARISVQLQAFRLSFIVKNIFNTEYVIRPMAAESPRNFTIQLIYKVPTKKS